MAMVNQETVHQVAQRARRAGIDVVDALDRVGLLVTDEKVKKIRNDAFQELRAELYRWTAAQFLRRVNQETGGTPMDMYRAILGYVDDYCTQEEQAT
jgi:hypothetical protein